MKTRILGKIEVSEIGMGCMAFSHGYGKIPDEAYSIEAIRNAYQHGCTFFDTAEIYSPNLAGTGHNERIVGKALREVRQDTVIATKLFLNGTECESGEATYNAARRHLEASLERLQTDYVDIYYHHIFDPNTPLEETALALDNAVRQGKTLYVGISNYNAAQTEEISRIFAELKTPFIINQPSYSMLNRWIEDDGLDRYAEESGIGLAVFSPLYQGFLTNRYLNGIPEDSRVGRGATWIGNQLTEKMVARLNKLNDIAASRGQTLSQMALSWVLHNKAVATVLIGASRPEQITENAACIQHLDFSEEELAAIEKILAE